MATPTAGTGTAAVQIKRTFTAPIERVFEAWTRPERLVAWFGRTAEEAVTRVVALDLRAGGQYCIEMQKPGKAVARLVGTYREVCSPQRLVFTWWRPDAEVQPSLVTVEFRRLGQSNFTEVLLTHELLPAAESEDYRNGWDACFDKLESQLATASSIEKELR